MKLTLCILVLVGVAEARRQVRHNLAQTVQKNLLGATAEKKTVLCNLPAGGQKARDPLGNITPDCKSTEQSLFLEYDTYPGVYAQMCVAPCTARITFPTNLTVGGIPCIGSTDVELTAPGYKVKKDGVEKCYPCTDVKPDSTPKDKAALTACALADKTVGYVLDKTSEFAVDGYTWTKGAFESAISWTEGAGGSVASWTIGAAGDVINWGEGAGNSIADWGKGAAGSIADWGKGAAGSIGDLFGR
mmetsp:Transcript_22372/g.48656  ORF Transcript_22372/g.48656 Transcript_22372/m.48656 type:complete len:245 (-) Transcript_22372:134-868(-)